MVLMAVVVDDEPVVLMDLWVDGGGAGMAAILIFSSK